MLPLSRPPRLCLLILLLCSLLDVGMARAADPFAPLLSTEWRFTSQYPGGPEVERFTFAAQTGTSAYGIYLQAIRRGADGAQAESFTYYNTVTSTYYTYVWDAVYQGYVEVYTFTLNGDAVSGQYALWDNAYTVRVVGPLRDHVRYDRLSARDNAYTVRVVGPFTLTGVEPLDFRVSRMQGEAPLTVKFTAVSGFSAWSWDFGDGANASGATPSHTYTTPGIYSVTLTARTTNSQNRTVSKDNLIVVADSSGRIPGNRYQFQRAWPTLQQPWYFSSPRGLAMDREGHLYVADAWNNRVAKYTGDGQFVSSFGESGKGDGQFLEPAGVGVDSNGFIYVTDRCFDKNAGSNGAYDYDACRVQKFDPQGAFLAAWKEVTGPADLLKGPTGISVAPDGSLLVADSQKNRIVRYGSDGQLLGVLAGFGSSNFNNPGSALEGEGGTLFVLDGGNNKLHKFSAFDRNKLVTSWSGPAAGPAMASPAGLTRDRSGTLYLTDFNNHRLLRLSKAGALTVLSDPGQGTSNGQFDSPLGIVADPSGNLYVGEYWGHRVQKFTTAGVFLSAWASWGAGEGMLNGPHAIEVSPAGTVLVADAENFRLAAFDGDGIFQTAWGSKGTGDGQFGEWQGHQGPHAVVAAPGKIIVADTLNDRIEEFNEQGLFVRAWGGYGTQAGQFKGPAGLALDGGGNLYVVEWDGDRVQKFAPNGTFLGQWGGSGSGNGQFDNPHGIAIDRQGFVYVADTLNHRVQKFDGQGYYLGEWGGLGHGDGQLYQPWDLAVDSDGNILVADTYNDRISRFTPQGVFLDHLGMSGTMPTQFRQPQGLAVGPDGTLVVAEYFNNRVQKFSKVTAPGRDKAIIVAGGGPYRGNYLWDATRASANFAYRALGYRGFTKESIRFLAADPTIDLDGNGQADDIAGDPTLASLRQAIVTWGQDADNLLLYLVDHGGENSFRLNDHELLRSANLDTWLDQLQTTMNGRVTVITDACQSGGFLPRLKGTAGKGRVVITSTQADESAYFINQGSISFSSFFWTHLFNGQDLKQSFSLAKQAMVQATGGDQHPLLDANGDGAGTSPADLTAVAGVTIGSAAAFVSQAPTVSNLSATVGQNGHLQLKAKVVANSGDVARVWATIRPPGYQAGGPDSPVQALPSVELIPGANDFYAGTFQASKDGNYAIAFQAKDSLGNTASPTLAQATVGGAIRRRAIIVAGGPATGELWPAVSESARLAYQALSFQGYQDEEIKLLAPASIPSLTQQPILPTLANLESAITVWAAPASTEDLVVYLVGEGDGEHFSLNPGQLLAVASLEQWLNANTVTTTVVGDFNLAGDFLHRLQPPAGHNRILVSAVGPGQAAHFLGDGDISFSRFFWREILNGRSVWDAFVEGKRAILAATGLQTAWLDDNGAADDATVGSLARIVSLGMGIRLAANDPQALSASADQTLTTGSTATIMVDTVTSSRPLTRVWAAISPPDKGQQHAAISEPELSTLELPLTAPGHYQAVWADFTINGRYGIAIYAQTEDGVVTLLKETSVRQQAGGDAYEYDDLPESASVMVLNYGPQHHNFHSATDSDWVKFYGLATVPYDVRVSRAGGGADTVLTIYDSDGQTVLFGPFNETGVGESELIINWTPTRDGIYYVEVHNHAANPTGASTEYDLEIITEEIGPDVGYITGIVRSSADRAILEGVGIDVLTSSGRITSAVTDMNTGKYFVVTKAGSYTLNYQKSNYAAASRQAVVSQGITTPLDIQLDPTVDTTPPNRPVVSGATPTKDTTPTWSWKTGGNGGNGTFRYKLDNADLTAGATMSTLKTFTPAIPLTAGKHTLYVQERDAAGNWSASGGRAIVIDLTPPPAPVVSGATPTKDTTPTWSWAAVGSSGNGTFRYKLDNSSLATGATVTTATAFTPLAALAAGPHTLYVQERDDAGNWSASGSRAIVVDLTPPTLGGVTPNPVTSEQGKVQELSALYSAPEGHATLQTVDLLVNATLATANGLFVRYDSAANLLSLYNDAGTAPVATCAPGQAGATIANSMGTLNCQSTQVARAGTDLTVRWSLTPKAAFSASTGRKVSLRAADKAGNTVPWASKGVWKILAANTVPAVGSLTPATLTSNVGVAKTFTAVYSDADGSANLKRVYCLVAPASTGTGVNAIHALYDRATNTLGLYNNAGTGLIPAVCTPGAAGILANQQGTLNCLNTIVTGVGNTLTVRWNITPKNGFAGAKVIKLRSVDNSNAVAGPTKKGNWTITAP